MFLPTATTSYCSPVDPSSLVPTASLDPRVRQLTSITLGRPILDYFLDVLTNAVAHTMSGNPYMVVTKLKTPALETYVAEFITRAGLSTNVILTAACYLRRLRRELLQADRAPKLCERLAGIALMVADKSINDGHRAGIWVNAFQCFNLSAIKSMEIFFLQMISYSAIVTNEELLWHYTPIMNTMQVYSSAWQALRERNIPRPSPPAPEPRVYPSMADLPDLAYPESPSSLGDLYDSDDSYSDSCSEVVTPPHISPPAVAIHTQGSYPRPYQAAQTQAKPFYPYPTPPSAEARTTQQSSYPYSPLKKDDREMNARARFFAAGRGTIVGPNYSPRYVPYSPSLANVMQQQQQAQQPVSTTAWHGLQPSCEARSSSATASVPWRQMQNWKSAPITRDTTWGNFGFFRPQDVNLPRIELTFGL